MVLDFVAKKRFENLRKRYNKAKSKLGSSKKSVISTKESEEIAGEQSTIAFVRSLDPYIVHRISKKNVEGEDDQDVQSDMENEGDFSEQEGLQKNEEDKLLQDNLNDEFGEENTSLSKGTKIIFLEEVKSGRTCLRSKKSKKLNF